MGKTIQEGRNIKRFKEMLGLKQKGLVYELGDCSTQKKTSLLKQKEEIENIKSVSAKKNIICKSACN